jgi:hypothetical protein
MRLVKLKVKHISINRFKLHASDVNLQSDEGKRLKGLLQAALVDESRRVRNTTTVVVVVLCSEDKGCEPEVREDPGKGSEVAFVGLHGG